MSYLGGQGSGPMGTLLVFIFPLYESTLFFCAVRRLIVYRNREYYGGTLGDCHMMIMSVCFYFFFFVDYECLCVGWLLTYFSRVGRTARGCRIFQFPKRLLQMVFLAFLVHFVEICQYFVGIIFFVMIVVRVPTDGILLSSSFSRENFLK